METMFIIMLIITELVNFSGVKQTGKAYMNFVRPKQLGNVTIPLANVNVTIPLNNVQKFIKILLL